MNPGDLPMTDEERDIHSLLYQPALRELSDRCLNSSVLFRQTAGNSSLLVYLSIVHDTASAILADNDNYYKQVKKVA
jgi:hypothetical protein